MPYHAQFPCAAFFICKNSERAKKIIVDWYTYKNPIDESINWQTVLADAYTSYPKKWKIGEYWEQDTLWLLIDTIKDSIEVIQEEIMFEVKDGQFLIHVSHERNELRKPYFSKYVAHLEQTRLYFEDVISDITVEQFDTSITLKSTF